MSNLQKNREQAALYHIWANKSLARSDLSRILKLKPPTVSALVNNLIQSGRIIEGKFADSSGGRRAKLLEIIPHWGWVIGLAFSSQGIVSASADMRGDIYNLEKTNLEEQPTREKILQIIKNTIRHQISYILKRNRNPILCLGVAISGLVDSSNGKSINFPRMEDWHNIPLKQILEKEFNIPVIMKNRITAITMAEHLFGNHNDSEDALIFLLGPGLGMGMILNGKVRMGPKWSVGEFGHITITENDALCYCGKRGCLESIASDFALVAQAKEAIKNGVNTRILDFAESDQRVTTKAICLAAEDGDRLANGLIERVGYYIATEIANLLNVLGPNVIIIGGLMVESNNIMLDCIRRHLRVNTLEYIEKHVTISRATFGNEGGIRGAVTIALNAYYSNQEF